MADHDETNQNNLNPEKAEANARIERDMALALKRQNRAGILGLSGMLGVVVLGGVAFAATQGGSGTSQPQPQPHAQVLAMHSASVSPKAQRSLAPSKATVKVNAELVALTKADATAQKATWTQVVAKNSALKGTHGVISPELAGLGTANLAVKANAVGGDRDTLEPPGIRLDASPGFDCTLEHPSIGMESGMATGGQGCHDCGGQRSDIRHV